MYPTFDSQVVGTYSWPVHSLASSELESSLKFRVYDETMPKVNRLVSCSWQTVEMVSKHVLHLSNRIVYAVSLEMFMESLIDLSSELFAYLSV